MLDNMSEMNKNANILNTKLSKYKVCMYKIINK